jgi:N-acylneuraminate cytidylyltransferase
LAQEFDQRIPRTNLHIMKSLLAVIPARGGSKGLPGKNVRPFAGMPLIAHSIRCASLSPEVERCVVTTDSEDIARVARDHGGWVPFLRPPELAGDDTPMIPVLQHALREAERLDSRRYEMILLLDPTSPGRVPEDIARAVELLEQDPNCVGVIGVSEPHFNPRWTCVEEREGYAALAFAGSGGYTRRQDVPPVYRINATLYLWRRDYLMAAGDSWLYENPPCRLLVVPETRAVHIDSEEDFRMAEIFVREGLVKLPWLEEQA